MYSGFLRFVSAGYRTAQPTIPIPAQDGVENGQVSAGGTNRLRLSSSESIVKFILSTFGSKRTAHGCLVYMMQAVAGRPCPVVRPTLS